jgi:transposase
MGYRLLLPIHQQFRGIATRYEKTARNFSAGLQPVCALAWVK